MAGKYHHGNLRQALIDNAIKLLEEEGLAALTLRRVAKESGVSQAAPYSHFKDKKALLTAVANVGFDRFEHRMAEEANALAAELYLSGLGKGYIYFALENPALFQLMFGEQLPDLIDVDNIVDKFGGGYHLLVAAVEGQPLAGLYVKKNNNLDVAFSWSLVHGLAHLLMAEKMTPEMYGADNLDDFIGQMMARYFVGPVSH